MRPRLQRDPAMRHPGEDFLHGFLGCTQLLLANHLTCFVQHAVPARTIAQVQTDGQPATEIALACCRRGATLLHCRSPYLLRFERVDNLGAYSIPSGDRPSHSICFHQQSLLIVKATWSVKW